MLEDTAALDGTVVLIIAGIEEQRDHVLVRGQTKLVRQQIVFTLFAILVEVQLAEVGTVVILRMESIPKEAILRRTRRVRDAKLIIHDFVEYYRLSIAGVIESQLVWFVPTFQNNNSTKFAFRGTLEVKVIDSVESAGHVVSKFRLVVQVGEYVLQTRGRPIVQHSHLQIFGERCLVDVVGVALVVCHQQMNSIAFSYDSNQIETNVLVRWLRIVAGLLRFTRCQCCKQAPCQC